jgi:phi13 family phage major tail protein
MANKVRYGLKNVYFSVLTEGTPDTYATPVAIPGAVSISLSPVGETTPFVGDDSEFFTNISNNGYDGTLEIGVLPEAFQTDVMGEVADAKKILFEKSSVQPKYFALLFEFTGDANAIKHVLYKCIATRTNLASKATVNKEISPTTLNLISRPNSAGYVGAKSKSDSDATVVTNWFAAVQTYVAPAG